MDYQTEVDESEVNNDNNDNDNNDNNDNNRLKSFIQFTIR